MTNKLLLGVAVSIIAASTFAYSAFAWHPVGVITKKVQNITNESVLGDADTTSTAIAAKPGDTLKYVIEVRNDGKADESGNNDMAKTIMTDTLPAGLELVSNPTQRTITENIGLIKPGQKVTKTYLVKVTTATEGAITNTACFTGDSTVNDNPQKGCNPAVVNVTIPEVETPVTPETPGVPETPTEETPVTEMPAELPQTGTGSNITLMTLGLGAAWYAAHRFILSRR
jgi:uncharacterized repeat protein (TIGR01451 family)